MSTFDRMLQALVSASTNQSLVTQQFSNSQASSTGRKHGRRGRRRNTNDDMSPETLEQRQLLAVTTYWDPVTNGGFATIVAESGDNVYLQKVASSPQSLRVAGDSSFSPGRRAVVPNIDAFERIVIREGTGRADSGVLPSGFPMSQPNITAFALNGVHARLDNREFSGTVSLTQPDGTRSSWDFSNAVPGEFYSSDVKITSGVGVGGVVAMPGMYYPVSVSVRGDGTVFGGRGRPEAAIVRWNVSQLPADANVQLDRITWYQYPTSAYDNVVLTDDRSITETAVQPSAPRDTTTVFALPNAAGPGLNDILLPTVHGTLTLDNDSLTVFGDGFVNDAQIIRFSTGGIDNRELRFPSAIEVRDFRGKYYAVWTKPGHYNRYISGFVDPVNRTINIEVIGITSGVGSFRDLYSPSGGPSAVAVDPGTATLSATYALASAQDVPVTATIFAGLDITNALDVRLTSPGSTVNIDSPVRVAANRTSLTGIGIAATNINFDAVVSTQARLDIDANGPTASLAAENARAVAKISGGEVVSIAIPPGWAGAGFDPDNAPKVFIAPPQSLQASASVRSLVNGRVNAITVTNGGTGYQAAPRVTIDPPTGGGQTATGDSVVANNTVQAVNLTNGGSGYSSAPRVRMFATVGTGATATASIVGRIGSIAVDTAGIGYTPNRNFPVTIRETGGGTGSGATATAIVDGLGSIASIRIDNPGDGYSLNNVVVDIPAPPPSVGLTAEAVAVVDPATTRIARIDITGPGSGYGAVPEVRIDTPTRSFAATGAQALVGDSGSVSSIFFADGVGCTIGVNQVNQPQGSLRQVSVSTAGTGYRVGQVISLVARRGGQTAQVQVQEVNGRGGVVRAVIFNPGTGFGIGDVLDQVPNSARGYGYMQAPRVFVSRPTAIDGIQAEAVAAIDNEGRVTGITVTTPGSGYDRTRPPIVFIDDTTAFGSTETVHFNAGVGASVYDIRLDQDRHTPVERSTLYVSSSGTLAADIFGNARAQSALIEVQNGDILLAGAVRAAVQSYQLVSSPDRQAFMPYVLTTFAESGVQTGRISGDTVSVTLANDLDTPNDGAVSFNDVSIQTTVNSLRVRAARRDGTAVTNPFPYRLAVAESDNISIDAVAASTFPIELSSIGNMFFNATLATAGGLVISKVDSFSVNTPISTTKGQISVSANSISVANSLQVLSTDPNPWVDDIVLDAKAGDISLNGGFVKAVNRVVMKQRNRTTAGAPQPGRPLWSSAQPISDFSTVSMQVEFDADFVLRNAEVSLDITHSFNSDLSATLVAPDGVRIPLFNRGVSGRNFTDTVFSSLATTPIRNGTAPYTGAFQPISSLAVLDGRRSRGVWTLEVQDNGSGAVGTLNSFGLRLTDAAGASTGRISGTSRLKANSLSVDAQGDVGNSTVLPGDSTYYLRTDVDTVEAFAGGTFSLYDSGSLTIERLEAKGHVSLRADGVDAIVGGNGRAVAPAIKALLTDVTAIDVSAPQGSIDVTMNTPSTVILGNAATLALDITRREGKVFPMEAGGDVKIRSVGGTSASNVVLLDAPLAGSGGRRVRFDVVTPLTSTSYDPGLPGFRPSVLKAAGLTPLSLDAMLGVTAGKTRIGDRVLIAGGLRLAGGGLNSNVNGVYVVRSTGTTWELARASEADTAAELPGRSIVSVDDGVRAGMSYRIGWSGADASFGNLPITATAVTFQTNIGSDDSRDVNVYVVSTPDGTNKSAGSFGKMILARQQNVANSPSDFQFSRGIATPIQLQQELPAIEKAFAIDGNRRFSISSVTAPAAAVPIVVDGTRIRSTSRNVQVTLDSEVTGIRFAAGSGGGSQVTAGSLSNIRLAGFRQGPAIAVEGASHVSIDGVQLGIDGRGTRLANRHGIVISGNAKNVTVSNSKIVGSTESGVLVRDTATGVTLVGNTIGQPMLDNKVGVSFSSTAGGNRLGVLPLVGVTVKAQTTVESFTLRLPANVILPAVGPKVPAATVSMANYIFVGQTIAGSNIVPGTRIVAINGTEVTLSTRMRQTGLDTITFGQPGRNVINSNVTGVLLSAGRNSVANSDITNSTFDGISIVGAGSGGNLIGLAPRLGIGSNAISGNGWAAVGLSQGAKLEGYDSTSKTDGNRVRFNYLSATSQGAAAAANGLGNIRSGTTQVTVRPYQPGATDRIDGSGNLHALPGRVTTGGKRFPWQPK
jgi:subtilisin-like proprotein convertase family protein